MTKPLLFSQITRIFRSIFNIKKMTQINLIQKQLNATGDYSSIKTLFYLLPVILADLLIMFTSSFGAFSGMPELKGGFGSYSIPS